MKTKRELAIEIFQLILSGNRDEKNYAAGLLSKLNDEQRGELLEAFQQGAKLIQDNWRLTTFRRANAESNVRLDVD